MLGDTAGPVNSFNDSLGDMAESAILGTTAKLDLNTATDAGIHILAGQQSENTAIPAFLITDLTQPFDASKHKPDKKTKNKNADKIFDITVGDPENVGQLAYLIAISDILLSDEYIKWGDLLGLKVHTKVASEYGMLALNRLTLTYPKGKTGKVIDINLRYVTIEADAQKVLVPNSISVSKVISVKK